VVEASEFGGEANQALETSAKEFLLTLGAE
jgi:hypothetical protein